MKVYRPIRTNAISQKFGESAACVKIGARGPVIYKHGLVCSEGYEDFYARLGLKGHNGWDLVAKHGEPVYFSVAADAEWYALDATDSSGGIGVDIISKQPIDGQYLKFRFWHLKNEMVNDDQPIVVGHLLGYADSTGASSGDHVHMEMKVCDETGITLNRENGYFGAMPFDEWYENRFILDAMKSPDKATCRERMESLSGILSRLFARG